ncbi:MAG: chorismate mutase [Methanobrevibacter sp.]|nr:chorismate mutase [Methanobrevibacter sp.]
MNRIRRDIDKIDEKIFKLLKNRLSKAKKIGELKKYMKVQVNDEEREKEILDKLDSDDYKAYKEPMTEIYKEIFNQMKNLEE